MCVTRSRKNVLSGITFYGRVIELIVYKVNEKMRDCTDKICLILLEIVTLLVLIYLMMGYT